MAARTKARRARKQSPTWWKWTKRTVTVFFLLTLIAGSILGFMFMQELNKAKEKIVNLSQLRDEVSTEPSYIYASDGKTVLYQISAEYRKFVPYEQIPKNVRNAVLAAEDKRFFEHGGVDAYALGRTLLTAVKDRSVTQGGSTLTMQLAKLLYTKGERTFSRKLGDIAMAYQMEKQLTKEEIFELYLNKVYFGSGAWGISAAADVYFGKNLDQLTIGEAALLARLVRRPSDENPYRNPKKALENRDVVLRIMRDENMITEDEYQKALDEKPKFQRKPKQTNERFNRANYFVWHVLDDLRRLHPDINLADGGYKIYTTLDPGLQNVAEDAVRETVRDHRRDLVTTAAFVAMDSDGRILCEVGGVDFARNQFNVVKDGLRQPGSSFKPFVYATAFATGAVSINDSISNAPFAWPLPGARPWTPKNSSGHYGGPVSVQTAFKMSMNVPAARVMYKTGPNTVLAYCRTNFGFTSPNLIGMPAMCLGAEEVTPLEMARAYSVFMLRGNRAEPYCIDRIIAPDGSVVEAYEPNISKNVLDANVTDQIDALMRAVVTSGTGTRASGVPDARGKTGTTSDNKDAWFCGYADGVVGIGWVANEIPRKDRPAKYMPMGRSVFGGKVTVEFWAKIMKYAQRKFGHPSDRPSLSRILASSRGSSDEIPENLPEDTPVPPDDPNKGPKNATDPGTGATPPIGPPDGGTVPPDTGPTHVQPPTGGPASVPPTTPPIKPPTNPPDNEKDSDMVPVEICAETGMRASIYCPETVTRRFQRGKEPRKRCTVHGG